MYSLYVLYVNINEQNSAYKTNFFTKMKEMYKMVRGQIIELVTFYGFFMSKLWKER